MSRRSATAWSASVAGVAATVISVLRILLANGSALSNLVWAEDGLFPLCVKAHGPFACATDPFSGYLLLLPRLVAWPISVVSMERWPLATNVAAGLLAGAAAVLAVLVLRAADTGVVASALVALLPVLAPIMGFEAINATGSSYMLLVFVAALAVCFPPLRRFPTWAYAVGAAVVALTIPSSALLLLPLAVQLLRRRIPVRGGLVTGAFLVAGLAVQAFAAVTADNPRRMEWSLDAARSWADTLPSAVITYWPGDTALTAEGSFSSATAAGWGQAGLVLALVVLVLGVVLVLLRGATANGVGLLLLVGLSLGVIPAAAGYANNRYFVIPALLWAAAVLVALDRWIPWRRELVMGVVAVVLIAVWIPSLRASEFRSSAVPEWQPMLEAARAACEAAPDGDATITFSPAWPFADAVFTGPTGNVVPCAVIAD